MRRQYAHRAPELYAKGALCGSTELANFHFPMRISYSLDKVLFLIYIQCPVLAALPDCLHPVKQIWRVLGENLGKIFRYFYIKTYLVVLVRITSVRRF